MKEIQKITIESGSDLRKWLSENYAQKESVWLVKWKKEAGKPFISYDEIVDELMCFGWVDSLPRKLDEQRTMLRISPRNPKSNWSRVNKARVARLIEAGKIEAPGLEKIALAKTNGAWHFLDEVEDLLIPSDLQEALNENEQALHFFERFPDSSKRGILEWIKNAKQAATRQKRISETVTKAANNLKANHPKGRDAGPKEC